MKLGGPVFDLGADPLSVPEEPEQRILDDSEDQETVARIKEKVEGGCTLPELQDASSEEEGTIACLRMDGRIGESPTDGRLYWVETWRIRG